MLDQLEQMRGDYRNWQDVIRCTQQLFTVHLDRLRMPYVHCIYSVYPAWLAFLSRPTDMTLLPTVRLWNDDVDRSPYDRGRAMFRSLMRRRVSDADGARLFGPGSADPVEQLIAVCGGQVRDLLRMTREVPTRATALPVDGSVIERVINVTRRDFLPIAVDDAAPATRHKRHAQEIPGLSAAHRDQLLDWIRPNRDRTDASRHRRR